MGVGQRGKEYDWSHALGYDQEQLCGIKRKKWLFGHSHNHYVTMQSYVPFLISRMHIFSIGTVYTAQKKTK